MCESIQIAAAQREQGRSLQLVRIAERQSGVISRCQALDCGLTSSAISRWVVLGRLRRVHPGVYSVGHRAFGIAGRISAALLYAGPGAALSHTTAAWWWQLIEAEPQRIHVSMKADRSSLPEVRVHRPRSLESARHRGLPVTTVARTLVDLAGIASQRVLRRALAQADYRRLLDPNAVYAVLGRGQPGSAALRMALARHSPQLARTLSVLEERFLALCEGRGFPVPEVNARLAGMTVDALWREQRVVVELDGYAAHGTRAAIERDRHREVDLRAHGYRVLRYTWEQVTEQADRVAADLRIALEGEFSPVSTTRR